MINMANEEVPVNPQLNAQKGRGLFKHEKTGPDVSGLVSELNSIGTRLRIIEERYTNLRRKSQVTEQNMLTAHKNINIEIKTINTEINEIRRENTLMQNKIKQIVTELNTFAKKNDVKTLERYINLWEPIKYVTEAAVEKIARRVVEDLLESSKKE